MSVPGFITPLFFLKDKMRSNHSAKHLMSTRNRFVAITQSINVANMQISQRNSSRSGVTAYRLSWN